jgi:hypothetical protein
LLVEFGTAVGIEAEPASSVAVQVELVAVEQGELAAGPVGYPAARGEPEAGLGGFQVEQGGLVVERGGSGVGWA